jgi:protein SHQ1
MPVVPKFSIDQDNDYVIITIRVPYVKISAAELITDNTEFTFYCRPYLLKLSFPYELEGEDDRCKATYDPDNDNGTLLAYLPKKTPGQHFPDLDLTTNLLQARIRKDTADMQADPVAPSIEIISDILNNTDDGCTDTSSVQVSPHRDLLIHRNRRYGFNEKYHSVFKNLNDHTSDILELEDPDKTTAVGCRLGRLTKENALFDMTRYLGDLFGHEDDAVYIEAMAFNPFWNIHWNFWKSKTALPIVAASAANDVASGPIDPSSSCGLNSATSRKNAAFDAMGGFSESEAKIMSHSLPRRLYLIAPGSREEKAVLLGLADILFAFCYEYRITLGEFNVESVENLCRLSSLLSWLDWFSFSKDSAKSVLIYSARRSLIYPYIREFKFTRKIWTDVAKILVLGKKCILKCMLLLRQLLEHSDSHYLLNKIFIDDYCIWLQSADNESLHAFAREFNDAKTVLESTHVVEAPKPVSSLPRPLIQEVCVAEIAEAIETPVTVPSSSDRRGQTAYTVGKYELGLNLVQLEEWAMNTVSRPSCEGDSGDPPQVDQNDCEDNDSESDDSESDERSSDEGNAAEFESDYNDADEVGQADFGEIPSHITSLPVFAEGSFNDIGDVPETEIVRKIESLLLSPSSK